MFNRHLAGLAACLGVALPLAAQQPTAPAPAATQQPTAAQLGRPATQPANAQLTAPAATASRSPAATFGRRSDTPPPAAPAAPAYAPSSNMLYGEGGPKRRGN